MLYYCKKCGRILQNNWDAPNCKCDCCKSITFPVPEKYWLNGLNFLINDETEKLLIEELVKTSPEFDQYLFNNRDEILTKQSAEFNSKMEHGRAILEGKSKKMTCPYCQSTSVSRIGLLNRIVSVELWGLASSKIGKQWRCHDCGSEF